MGKNGKNKKTNNEKKSLGAYNVNKKVLTALNQGGGYYRLTQKELKDSDNWFFAVYQQNYGPIYATTKDEAVDIFLANANNRIYIPVDSISQKPDPNRDYPLCYVKTLNEVTEKIEYMDDRNKHAWIKATNRTIGIKDIIPSVKKEIDQIPEVTSEEEIAQMRNKLINELNEAQEMSKKHIPGEDNSDIFGKPPIIEVFKLVKKDELDEARQNYINADNTIEKYKKLNNLIGLLKKQMYICEKNMDTVNKWATIYTGRKGFDEIKEKHEDHMKVEYEDAKKEYEELKKEKEKLLFGKRIKELKFSEDDYNKTELKQLISTLNNFSIQRERSITLNNKMLGVMGIYGLYTANELGLANKAIKTNLSNIQKNIELCTKQKEYLTECKKQLDSVKTQLKKEDEVNIKEVSDIEEELTKEMDTIDKDINKFEELHNKWSEISDNKEGLYNNNSKEIVQLPSNINDGNGMGFGIPITRSKNNGELTEEEKEKLFKEMNLKNSLTNDAVLKLFNNKNSEGFRQAIFNTMDGLRRYIVR